jgi:hypothetical protein
LQGFDNTPDSSVAGGLNYYRDIGNDQGSARLKLHLNSILQNPPQNVQIQSYGVQQPQQQQNQQVEQYKVQPQQYQVRCTTTSTAQSQSTSTVPKGAYMASDDRLYAKDRLLSGSRWQILPEAGLVRSERWQGLPGVLVLDKLTSQSLPYTYLISYFCINPLDCILEANVSS